jgi:xanthine dehydrogenase iron-sulfur-binding subunit
MTKKSIKCRVNGVNREYFVDVRSSLMDLLRGPAGLDSIKHGCDVGECGACTVLINGRPFNSCIYLAVWAEGKEIVTLEGVTNPDGSLSDIQQAFVDEGAVQCGICTPGFIMASIPIINQETPSTREEYYKEPISEALVTRAHIFGEALFYSNLEGDLYCLSGAGEELLIKGVGELLSLDNHYFYTLFNGNLELIDRAEMKVVKSLTGGSYETATFGREGLLFLEEESLKRQSYTSGEIKEVLSGIRSYGREGYCLVTASTEGGLCISCLDGTAKRRISDDLADSLLLIDGRLYYFNLYDNKAIYTIKIEDEVRSALFSETLTDGGLQFIRYGSGEEQSLLEAYLPFLQEVVGKQSQYGEQQLPYDGKVIFITQTGEFYHRKGEEITLNDLFYLALITYHSTHLGTYSDGGQAFRTDTVITLFVPFDPNPLISITVRGYDPIQIKTGEGDRYGMLASWHPAALRLLESDMFKQVLSH